MKKEKKEIIGMSEREIEQEMRDEPIYGSRYFELERELKERDK